MAGSKINHFDEVAKHSATNDCWLIISGKVYDVTPFMAEHPGGLDVLKSASGKDATIGFEDVGHSSEARGLMEEYCIGNIDSSTLPKDDNKPPHHAIKNPDHKPDQFVITTMLPFIVPIIVLGVSFAVRYFTK